MASGSPIYKWVPVDLENVRTLDGYLPQGAVLAGWEGGKPTYVARAHHNGHWELGKLNHWATIGYASFGVELEVHEGEVLVAVEDQTPVWINGAFGEEVEGVMTSQADNHKQLIARVWHRGRWVPGKVVPFCNRCYFPFGGKEWSKRKYQLLSSDFAWSKLPADGRSLLEAVPLDSCLPADETNSIIIPHPNARLDRTDGRVLTRFSLQECQWEVSGDGEWHRHALSNEQGRQLARGWVRGEAGLEQWVQGVVHENYFQAAGTPLASPFKLMDYQVLVSKPTTPPTATGEPPELSSRLLSLSISLETLEGMLENDLTPPEDIFMVTKLNPYEDPWSAVKDMLTQDKHTKGRWPQHLRTIAEALVASQGESKDKAA